jgi:hypothetical protein
MMTGSYNNFFKIINRHDKRDVMLEASKDIAKPKTILKPRKVMHIYSLIHRHLSLSLTPHAIDLIPVPNRSDCLPGLRWQ